MPLLNYRSLYEKAPSYVGQYEFVAPPNPKTNITYKEQEGDELQIMLIGRNVDEYVGLWDDTRQFIFHEKIEWWHDYVAMMINKKKLTHVWGTNDFCNISGFDKSFAAAVEVFRVNNYEEFDELYRLNPIRKSVSFWFMLLQPIADQRDLDEQRLANALKEIG